MGRHRAAPKWDATALRKSGPPHCAKMDHRTAKMGCCSTAKKWDATALQKWIAATPWGVKMGHHHGVQKRGAASPRGTKTGHRRDVGYKNGTMLRRTKTGCRRALVHENRPTVRRNGAVHKNGRASEDDASTSPTLFVRAQASNASPSLSRRPANQESLATSRLEDL